jgi:hypothetical protein
LRLRARRPDAAALTTRLLLALTAVLRSKVVAGLVEVRLLISAFRSFRVTHPIPAITFAYVKARKATTVRTICVREQKYSRSVLGSDLLIANKVTHRHLVARCVVVALHLICTHDREGDSHQSSRYGWRLLRAFLF